MTRQVHGIDRELVRKKRYQRTEVLNLSADGVEKNQRRPIP